MSLPKPNYSIWDAIGAALAVGMRALNEVRALSREPGPKGEPGERGKDALAISDLDISSPDGGRTLVFTFNNGEEKQVRELKTWTLLDRGVYRAENSYQRGDCVSWDGSLWIAQDNSTGDKPGQAGKAWRLAVKRGRDGKDGQSVQGPQGPEGKPGRDLTQLGPDGSKW